MRHFRIKKKIHPDIKHEVGDILKVPNDMTFISLLTSTGKVKTNLTDEEFYKEITFESIKKDYEEYGYLEDYQVEWLLDKLGKIHIMAYSELEGGSYSNKLTEIQKILENNE